MMSSPSAAAVLIFQVAQGAVVGAVLTRIRFSLFVSPKWLSVVLKGCAAQGASSSYVYDFGHNIGGWHPLLERIAQIRTQWVGARRA